METLKTIAIGVAIGLATLWLWERMQRRQVAAIGGDSILSRVFRMWSTPSAPQRFELPTIAAVAAAENGGGCGCN
jgi:hypothetical protein